MKIVIAVALIILAGGAWLYLDCLNKQEKASSEQMHQGIKQARAEAKKRAEMKINFASNILADLGNCQLAAEKGKNDYMHLAPQA